MSRRGREGGVIWGTPTKYIYSVCHEEEYWWNLFPTYTFIVLNIKINSLDCDRSQHNTCHENRHSRLQAMSSVGGKEGGSQPAPFSAPPLSYVSPKLYHLFAIFGFLCFCFCIVFLQFLVLFCHSFLITNSPSVFCFCFFFFAKN